MFNKDFLWGVATASYQIEGAAYEDGKGLSVWDMFTKTEGNVFNMDSGDSACDSYHRVEEDVALLKQLGVKAYRFSLAWPRIIPNGVGEVCEAGLAYYDRLIDALLEAGIEPYVTIFHWDYPYELYKKGHWLNDESSDWFEAYTRVVAKRYGDRVKNWITINEPQCFVGLGYSIGEHAPGYKLPNYDIVRMSHNVLLSHGKAVRAIREIVGEGARVGFAFVAHIGWPKTDSEADVAAAKEFNFNSMAVSKEDPMTRNFMFDNDFWYDPVLFGKYPDWVIESLGDYLPKGDQLDRDMAIISSEVDFLGINTYNGPMIEDDNGQVKVVQWPEGYPMTGFNWPVTEEMLYWGTKFMYERYKKPIYITENGLSNKDWVALDGKVHDEGRIDFLKRYLGALERSWKDGTDIAGYFQWSFLDNFEWAAGYRERFGLVHVDFTTGTRTPKESYYWYSNLIKN